VNPRAKFIAEHCKICAVPQAATCASHSIKSFVISIPQKCRYSEKNVSFRWNERFFSFCLYLSKNLFSTIGPATERADLVKKLLKTEIKFPSYLCPPFEKLLIKL